MNRQNNMSVNTSESDNSSNNLLDDLFDGMGPNPSNSLDFQDNGFDDLASDSQSDDQSSDRTNKSNDLLETGEFLCNVCNKTFNLKKNLYYHKKHEVCTDKKFNCKYCNNVFSSKSTMYRHMRLNCKVKKDSEKEKEEIYARLLKLEEDNKKILQLEKENTKLKSEMKNIKKIMTKKVSINNGTININNSTVVQNNITLVGYGNEDISKIDRKDMLKILQNGYHSTIKLTETLHFNPKYPEYHNVYITNIKDKYAMMFDGKTWTLTTKDELIDRIYDDKKNFIEENLDDFIASLSVSRRKALERWLETEENDKKIKEIKERIKLLMYNLRNIPMGTQTADHMKQINTIDPNVKVLVDPKRTITN